MKETLTAAIQETPAGGHVLEELRRRAAERGRLRYLERMIPLLLKRQRELKHEVYGGIRVTQSWSSLPGRPGRAIRPPPSPPAPLKSKIRKNTGARNSASGP